MKSITLLLLLSGIILSGFLLYASLNFPDIDSLETDTSLFKQDSNPLTVEYTNKGYIPATLKIKQGETVTFINRSSRSMWVASANHPTHNIYPEFDQKGLSKGEEAYTFTFEKIGDWRYHDHLNPRVNGTIIVE